MWPRTPRHAAATPKPQSRRARRAAENIELQKRRDLARLTVQRKTLEVTKEHDAYAEERTDRAAAKKATRSAQVWSKVGARLAAIRQRLADDRPLLAALAVSGLCLMVTIGGQLMVYTSLNWHGWPWIAYLLPFIVEGTTWTFATFAAYLATRPVPLPYAKYTRSMWLFATYAASSNTWHFAHDLGDAVTGALLGGASLVGPYVWHRYVSLAKVARSGRSAAQIRAAVLQRLYYPVLSLRASAMWSAAGGAMSRDLAWKLVWSATKGAAPGVAMRRTRRTKRVSGVVEQPGNTVTETGVAQPSATPEATRVHEQTSAVAQTLDNPDATPLADEVADFLATWNATPNATPEGGDTATIELPDIPRSTGVAQPPATPEATRPATPAATPAGGVARNPQQPPATPEVATAAAKVAEYFRNQVAAGVAPADVSPTDAARFAVAEGFQCTRQNATKVLDRLRREQSERA